MTAAGCGSVLEGELAVRAKIAALDVPKWAKVEGGIPKNGKPVGGAAWKQQSVVR